MEPHIVTAENAANIAEWLKTRNGIAIWRSIDLSNPNLSLTTPVTSADGKPVTKPHWRVGNEPARIITDPAEVIVSEDVEVKRFHVAVRVGSQGLSWKVTDGGSRRIRAEVAKAGEGAYHFFDYGDYKNAVIMRPAKQTPLVEWLKRV